MTESGGQLDERECGTLWVWAWGGNGERGGGRKKDFNEGLYDSPLFKRLSEKEIHLVTSLTSSTHSHLLTFSTNNVVGNSI